MTEIRLYRTSLSHERESTKSSLGGSGTKTGRPFCGSVSVLVDKQFGRYSSQVLEGRRWVIKTWRRKKMPFTGHLTPSQGAPGLLF